MHKIQQMDDNNNSSSQDNLDNQSQVMDSSHSLKQLARAISIPPDRLTQICMSQQQLKNKLKQFNDVAVLKIQGESYNQALIYLQEAEKILEAAVNRGNKKIDRIFIICTLQNEACAYQKLWELQKSAEYMQAIIHNMESEVKNSNSELQQNYFAQDVIDDKQAIKKCISKLTLMGLYYLQYLAVTSQIKDHQTAYQTSVKALTNFKMACQKCYKLQTLESDTHVQSVLIHNNMVGQLASLNQQVDIQKIPQQIKETKKVLAKLRHSTSRKKSITDKAIICFRDFSIGQVMQICPITLNELILKINSKEQVTNMSKLYKALYISICFFSMATQKRLMCTEVSRKFQNRRQSCQAEITQNLKISQSYHLKAIYIVAKFIPSDNKYLQHIIKSLKNHYEIDLLDYSNSDLIQQVSSIDLESQNMMASYDRGQTGNHTNFNTYSNTAKIKSQKKQPLQRITKYLKSERSSKPNKKKTQQQKTDEHADGVKFGNTVIKKQMEYHFHKKIFRSQKHIKTVFSDKKSSKHKKQNSKSNSKSNKKTDRRSKNSKIDKKQSVTVYTQKKTNPTSVRSIEHGNNRLIGSKKYHDKNIHNAQNICSQQAFKTSQYNRRHTQPNQLDGLNYPSIKKSEQKKHQKSKLKKKKKVLTKENPSQSKDKSKSKSRSKSSKRIINTSKQDKNQKKIHKIKKKQHKLQQEYFIKPDNQQKRRNTKHKMQHKSNLKKNSIKIQEGSSPPGRNTINNNGHKNTNIKNSMKYY